LNKDKPIGLTDEFQEGVHHILMDMHFICVLLVLPLMCWT